MASIADYDDREETGWRALLSGLRKQQSIISAIILQDMSARYARTRFGMITAVLEPLMMLVGMFLMRYYIGGVTTVAGIPLILFLVTGYMTDLSFRTVANGVMGSVEKKPSSRMFPHVMWLDVILARGVSSSIVAAGAMIAASTIACLIENAHPHDLLLCWMAAMLNFGIGIPLGIVFGVVVRVYPSTKLIFSLIIRLNFIMSGTLFTATELPPSMLAWVSWIPTFHAVEMMREGWFFYYTSPFASPVYVILWIIGLFAIGLPLERLSGRARAT